ncbi:GNAT family N-acetyltransferase [Paraglaciecola aquimarina]|uniref:GNAT family N-acetyltransferase n=1 Tax=Paraglaciecola aquimarina TaxID=1235557 RepID=A0ABU3SWK0_9ALTE|nr:GNAT family N-acetyltransferase [Paraglaciecola aquimarina]MDU0354391.1 GNAT family N-acetyltransferase [Paraglaciecola aquimarina]
MNAKYEFRLATLGDAVVIAELVCALTQEITSATGADLVDQLPQTSELCKRLMGQGEYAAFLAIAEQEVVAIATFTETYALYAGGKMGVIQECYVRPEHRGEKIGARLLAHVKQYGKHQSWACIELCTPPLPAYSRTLNFYQQNGLVPVGGRKMREMLT